MTIRTLKETGQPFMQVRTDACIVGAGPAGLVAAVRIARSRRLRVVIVESGLHDMDSQIAELDEIDNRSPNYEGLHGCDFMLAQWFTHDLRSARQRITSDGKLTYVICLIKLTYMEKTQVYLRKEELDALRKVAARSRRSVAALVREAVRKVVLMPAAEGPIAIWDGEPKRSSLDHDSVHDEP